MKSKTNYVGQHQRGGIRSFVTGLLFAGWQGAMAAISLDDLEPIPQDQWADIIARATSVQNLGNENIKFIGNIDELEEPSFNSNSGNKIYSGGHTKKDLHDRLVVNGETNEQYNDRIRSRRWLDQVQSDLSNECKDCIDEGNNFCPTSN